MVTHYLRFFLSSIFEYLVREGFSFFACNERVDIFVLFVHRAKSLFCVGLVQNSIWKLLFVSEILLDHTLVVVEHNLFVKQVLVLTRLKTEKFEVKVERRHLIAHRLVVFVMQVLHIRVGKSFTDRDALVGVENEHFFD